MVLALVFLSVASGTMINVALPFIGAHFAVPEPVYGWVVTAFVLTFGVFSAVHGRLADVFGVRRLYLGGALCFGVGSLASALAPTIGSLIAVRLLTGIGAAAIPALGVTIVTRMLPADRRGGAMGAIMAVVGVSATLSPFLGGALLQITSWRAVFVVPAVVLGMVPFAWRMLPDSLDQVEGDVRFDAAGGLLLGSGAACLLGATSAVQGSLSQAGGLAALGTILLVGFLVRIHGATAPFVPPELLRQAPFMANVVVGSLVNGARFGAVVLVPILLEETSHVGPLGIGAVLVPGAIALAILSPIAGRLSDRRGARQAAQWGVFGSLVTTVAMIWLVGGGMLGLAVGMAASGAAFAFVQPPILGSLGSVLPRSAMGVGNGLYMMLFFLGGAFGVAIALSALAAQAPGSPAWVPGVPLEVGRYANAVAVLGLWLAPAMVAWRFMPGGADR